MWDASRFGTVPSFLREAAAVHDDGWIEWDRRPRLEAGKDAPHGYAAMPTADYREIWRRGTDRGWAAGPEVGLLVSLHGMRFFGHRTAPEDRALYAVERARQRDALRRLGAEPADEDAPPPPWRDWSDWLFFWDGLSLFLCGEFESPWRNEVPAPASDIEIAATRQGEDGKREVVLDPFPFQRDFDVEILHWRIPRVRYPEQATLDAAMETAARGWRRFRIRAA